MMENLVIRQHNLAAIRAEDKVAADNSSVEKSDAELVKLVLAGNDAAFAEIFERYKRIVALIAARYFRQPQEVEEMIQISFTKAYFELKSFRGGHDFSLAGWLGKITSNACLDAIKKKKRQPEDLLCEFSDSENEAILGLKNGENVENDLVGRILAEKLLANLPAADRALLEMLLIEEMSVAEVADITGHSKANVKVRAYRARLLLRKILKKIL